MNMKLRNSPEPKNKAATTTFPANLSVNLTTGKRNLNQTSDTGTIFPPISQETI